MMVTASRLSGDVTSADVCEKIIPVSIRVARASAAARSKRTARFTNWSTAGAVVVPAATEAADNQRWGM